MLGTQRPPLMISKHGGKKAELRRSEWLWTLNVPPRRRHRGGVHSTEIARSGNSAQPPLVSVRLPCATVTPPWRYVKSWWRSQEFFRADASDSLPMNDVQELHATPNFPCCSDEPVTPSLAPSDQCLLSFAFSLP